MTSKTFLKACLAGVLMTTACTGTDSASSNMGKPPLPQIEIKAPTSFPPEIHGEFLGDPEQFKYDLINAFKLSAEDGKLSSEKIESELTRGIATNRGKIVGGILSGDIDNDGDLSARELLSFDQTPRRIGTYTLNHRERISIAQGDRNRDGILSADEIRQLAYLYSDAESVTHYNPVYSLMTFDSNKDGILTKFELKKELDDLDHLVSQSEKFMAKFVSKAKPSIPELSEQEKLQQEWRNDLCKSKLKVPETAEIILLSGNSGTALSTVTATDQYSTTQVTQVIIEDGPEPLYIIASTGQNMIWSFQGHTDRISGFVARKAYEPAGVGVLGLPARKVDFISSSCRGYLRAINSSEDDPAKTHFVRAYGRPIDRVISNGRFDNVAIPSGQMLGKARRKARQEIEKETVAKRTKVTDGLSLSAQFNHDAAHTTLLYRTFPDGIAYVDADQVVAPRPLVDYEVYPSDAGLIQLIESGHIEETENAYHIKKTFARFPVDAFFRHDIILEQGVSRPCGKVRRNIQIIDAATGENLADEMCF